MKTTRYKFALPARGEPGYQEYLHCSTTTNDPQPGARCHNTPRWKIASTRDATRGVRYACDNCAHLYPLADVWMGVEVREVLRARWELVSVTEDRYTIRDIGHAHGRSVTNDAEWVVAQLAPELAGRRLFYYDSTGRLDEIRVVEGRFFGFAPGADAAERHPRPDTPETVAEKAKAARQVGELFRKTFSP